MAISNQKYLSIFTIFKKLTKTTNR